MEREYNSMDSKVFILGKPLKSMYKSKLLPVLLLFGFMFILFPFVDGKAVRLDGCTIQNNYDNGSLQNATITLSTGWNLIGNPTDRALALNELIFSNSTGSYNYNQAHSSGFINLTTVDESGLNNHINIQVPTQIEKYSAYWVYAREAGNLTLPNVRSTGSGKTFRYSDLMVSNGTTELSVDAANDLGWIGREAWAYDHGWKLVCNDLDVCDIDTFSGTQSIFIKSYKPGILVSKEGNISLNEGWNAISFSEDSVNTNSWCEKEKPKKEQPHKKNKQKIKIMIPHSYNGDEPVYNTGKITIKLPDLILLG
jgi:hypothetical protein